MGAGGCASNVTLVIWQRVQAEGPQSCPLGPSSLAVSVVVGAAQGAGPGPPGSGGQGHTRAGLMRTNISSQLFILKSEERHCHNSAVSTRVSFPSRRSPTSDGVTSDVSTAAGKRPMFVRCRRRVLDGAGYLG